MKDIDNALQELFLSSFPSLVFHGCDSDSAPSGEVNVVMVKDGLLMVSPSWNEQGIFTEWDPLITERNNYVARHDRWERLQILKKRKWKGDEINMKEIQLLASEAAPDVIIFYKLDLTEHE